MGGVTWGWCMLQLLKAISLLYNNLNKYLPMNRCGTELWWDKPLTNLLWTLSSDLFPEGIIRTALPNMDREAKEEYHVVIQAKDMGGHMGGLSGTTKVTITLTDVNDNPPKFPQSKSSVSCFSYQKPHWSWVILLFLFYLPANIYSVIYWFCAIIIFLLWLLMISRMVGLPVL